MSLIKFSKHLEYLSYICVRFFASKKVEIVYRAWHGKITIFKKFSSDIKSISSNKFNLTEKIVAVFFFFYSKNGRNLFLSMYFLFLAERTESMIYFWCFFGCLVGWWFGWLVMLWINYTILVVWVWSGWNVMVLLFSRNYSNIRILVLHYSYKKAYISTETTHKLNCVACEYIKNRRGGNIERAIITSYLLSSTRVISTWKWKLWVLFKLKDNMWQNGFLI